jgi:hypothetical protein
MEKINNNVVIFILIIQYLHNTIATLSNLQKVNINNYNELYDIF